MSHQPDSLKSILFALGANGAIALAKLAAALVTGSGTMMAEAIHSFADTGNQLLLLVGLRGAKRPPTPDYPLGFGKTIYFWSFIVALMLFSMGGLYSVYEGIHKLRHPEPLSHPLIAIGVLVFSLIAEGISMWGCLREVKKTLNGRSLWRWFRETRQSELLVVLGEDFAALWGLSFALAAVILSMVLNNPIYDAAGSIVIGVLLILVAFFVGIEVKALLIGQSVEPELKEQMIDFLLQRAHVDQVYSLLTLQLGKDVMVAVKARMKGVPESGQMIQAINDCEKAFKARFPMVMWLFFEPDIKD